jgi:hypothetical protein
MAGYSGRPLAAKLGIKEGFRVGLVNQPEGFEKALGSLPNKATIVDRLLNPINLVVLFVEAETALRKNFARVAGKLAPDGMLWVAWPKKASGVSTDLSFISVQQIGLQAGMVDVKICAIDEIWSGLKFVYRLKDRPRL